VCRALNVTIIFRFSSLYRRLAESNLTALNGKQVRALAKWYIELWCSSGKFKFEPISTSSPMIFGQYKWDIGKDCGTSNSLPTPHYTFLTTWQQAIAIFIDQMHRNCKLFDKPTFMFQCLSNSWHSNINAFFVHNLKGKMSKRWPRKFKSQLSLFFTILSMVDNKQNNPNNSTT